MSHEKTAACSVPALTSPIRLLQSLGNRGFTLVELIIVFAIIAALAYLSFPAYTRMKDMAREVRCMAEIRDLEKLIVAYSIDRAGALPASLADIGQGDRKDPWGRAFFYGVPARMDTFTKINGDYDLYSAGSDGLTAVDITDSTSADDVVRTGDGGFVGLAEKLLP